MLLQYFARLTHIQHMNSELWRAGIGGYHLNFTVSKKVVELRASPVTLYGKLCRSRIRLASYRLLKRYKRTLRQLQRQRQRKEFGQKGS